MKNTWLHNPRDGAPCTIIAEVAQAHEGSVGMAHAFIDEAARCGADAIKFQTHIASAESTVHEPWRKAFSSQDKTRLDYWRRMEFKETEWIELKTHAIERDLLFLSSPFSLEAMRLLERVGVAGWKIASGEISSCDILDAMLVTQLPLVLSTGMSTMLEIDETMKRIKLAGSPVALLQCTTAYPCEAELVGLNVIGEFRERYECAVGLSDHSATIYPGLAAVTLGIDVLEVHLTLSRAMFGPDVSASVTPDQLRDLVKGIRFIEAMNKNPVDKNKVSEEIHGLKKIFSKSVVAAVSLPAGTVLQRKHLDLKKPGSGIPANQVPTLIGRRLNRALSPDDLITYNDFD
tara:strand:- start:140 stop:1177 length:1038 start_codon:yes stop_codon:yes gene_type:complete